MLTVQTGYPKEVVACGNEYCEQLGQQVTDVPEQHVPDQPAKGFSAEALKESSRSRRLKPERSERGELEIDAAVGTHLVGFPAEGVHEPSLFDRASVFGTHSA